MSSLNPSHHQGFTLYHRQVSRAQAVTSVIKLLAKTSGRIRGLLEVEIRSGDEVSSCAKSLALQRNTTRYWSI